jgi:hypothetical protein
MTSRLADKTLDRAALFIQTRFPWIELASDCFTALLEQAVTRIGMGGSSGHLRTDRLARNKVKTPDSLNNMHPVPWECQ